MNENTLIILLFLYSLFEFLLKRLFWKPNTDKVVLPALILFFVLAAGCIGIEDPLHVVSYIVIVVLYAFLAALEKHLYSKDLRNSLQLFLVKQLFMFVLLYAVALLIPFSEHNSSAFEPLLAPFERLARWWKHNYQIALVVSTGYLFLIEGGTQIVRNVLAKFPGTLERALQSMRQKGDGKSNDDNSDDNVKNNQKDNDQENSDATTLETKQEQENAGEWIGILERMIVMSFVLTNSFSAIAFALAAKSIARFKELEDKDFAEYYLLGTSASVGIAILVGLLVKVIVGF